MKETITIPAAQIRDGDVIDERTVKSHLLGEYIISLYFTDGGRRMISVEAPVAVTREKEQE